jgi:hypothetical protein
MEPFKNHATPLPTASAQMTADTEKRHCSCGAPLSLDKPWFDNCAKCYRHRRGRELGELNRRVFVAEAAAAKAQAGLDPRMTSHSWAKLRDVVSVSRHYDKALIERIKTWAEHNRRTAYEAEQRSRRMI